jgi:hypothetical protein
MLGSDRSFDCRLRDFKLVALGTHALRYRPILASGLTFRTLCVALFTVTAAGRKEKNSPLQSQRASTFGAEVLARNSKKNKKLF